MRESPYLDHLVPAGVRRVLHVHGEKGRFGARLKAHRPEIEVWGLAESRLASWQGETPLDRSLVLGPDTLAELPKARFDLIVAQDAPLSSELLSTLRPSLAAEGKLLLDFPHAASTDAVLGLFQGRASAAFTLPAVLSLLRESGYRLRGRYSLRSDPPGAPVLAEALERLGEDPATVQEALTIERMVLEAEPMPLPIDLRTRGQLGPARHGGSSIVILAYNSAPTIERCLASVLATAGSGDEVLLVDNASSDDTLRIVARFEGDARLKVVRNAENLGFSAGCNVGLRASGGARLVLLNPDTEVYPGWLGSFERALTDPSVGLVGPVSDRVAGDQFVGHYLGLAERPRLSAEELADEFRQGLAGRTRPTRLLVGLCAAARRETLDEVGLLDEALFLGSDDLELSWRLRACSYELRVTLDTFVRHVGGISFASEPKSRIQGLLDESTSRLLSKVGSAYGYLPPLDEIWGIDLIGRRPEAL